MSLRSRTALLCIVVGLATPGLAEGSAGAAPNDPYLSLQWGSANVGQNIPTQGVGGKEPLGPPANGTPGADDRALPAWRVTTGTRSIVIAELDTGVEYTHPDLAANIWSNPGAVGGCPTGTHGYNVLDHTCEPTDEDTAYEGHGTHVAGIMGAVANNGAGVAGMNWQTSILPVKWLQSAGAETGALLEALEWILRVKQEGVNVRVVNDSPTFFGTLRSEAVKKEIELLGANNILFVAAAGNTGNNNDEEAVRRYPCGYHLSNEICVTATDNRDALPTWANYGPKTVDLAAPGVSIYSTLRGESYGYLTGGSMASPQVAGAAALILSQEPSLSTTQLKARILENVRPDAALTGKVTTGGILDVCEAMPGCKEKPVAPTVVTGAASSVTPTAAVLNGSVNPNGEAVGDCHFEYGPTSAYGSSVPCVPAPGSGNGPVAVSASIAGLGASTTYHFRLVASSAGGTSKGPDVTFTSLASPPAPTVVAGAASSVTQTAAVLNGSVNPNGEAVGDCHFEYGPTSAYGSSVPCVPAPGSGTSPVAVSASISGLSASTTYHFLVVASSAGGTSSSVDGSLTTVPLAEVLVQPAPTSEHASTPGAHGTAPLPFMQGSQPPPPVTLAGTSLSVSPSGTVALKIRCPATVVSCTGTLRLRTLRAVIAVAHGLPPQPHRPEIVTLATGRFALAGGTAQTVKLRLSSAGRRLLARVHALPARVTILVRKADGTRQALGIGVELRAPRVPR